MLVAATCGLTADHDAARLAAVSAGAVTLGTGAYGLALFGDPERNDR